MRIALPQLLGEIVEAAAGAQEGGEIVAHQLGGVTAGDVAAAGGLGLG
jgi:hypothetical protein